MKPSDEPYRENAYEAEVDRYIRAAQNNDDTDWTRFDEDANSKLLAKLNALLRDPSKHTNDLIRRFGRAYASILALELIDKHLEYCATESARICRENGKL